MNNIDNAGDGNENKMSWGWTLFWFIFFTPIGIYRLFEHAFCGGKSQDTPQEKIPQPQIQQKQEEKASQLSPNLTNGNNGQDSHKTKNHVANLGRNQSVNRI